MTPAVLNIWQSFTGHVAEAVDNVAASVSAQGDKVRDAAADVVAKVGLGIGAGAVDAAANIGSTGNKYQVIQKVGKDWRTWAILGLAILVVFFFIVRKHKRGK